ncbi:hypothetical protein JOB18_045407 [Solea senegalensis]|uniref:Zinc transporter ZIP6 n=1 Tax=Solea senegalensis TaxID=28829 RepID=A0AAV6TBM0_SOLSE|nr:zinc transporter ZIP6 [Solea senegalensis]XP_043882482.1 zinc transporter ZIP6 [Solea senegalensis]XP_043882492.1 zinc transporter ZIP6 [Solea senegalensis]XP_043882499.1 zinc transporter ZIP6 [Solea senegalensis]KAG7526806.1 zinc transporter ZIP6 [Solea senegalensis]KAG7526807.1 hypothetical protein JOB18_045407 [Solea senegalensis]KAG7526808.1 hypothetical protein JOB18_045407 [Solea senegalensis]KAG7526809.1 hypothetical protein JOB18_045407 [Solea senegalensis]
MARDEKSRGAVAVVLLIVSMLGCGSSSESDRGTSTPEVTRLVSAVVDPQRAEQSQRRHLEALFNRYGENGSISLDGLKRLLQSVGLDRIRTVMVQHHEQLDHHHGHHLHDNNSHDHKLVHSEALQPEKFQKNQDDRGGTRGKKQENPENQQNLYLKKTTAVQEVGTAAVYSAQLLAKQGGPGQHSAAGDQTTRAAVTRATVTEAAAVSRGDDHDHSQDPDHDHVNGSIASAECLNAYRLLSSHGMSQEVGMALGDFSYLCPALLNQIDAGACIVHAHTLKDGKHHKHAHGHHGDHNHSDHDHSERTAVEKNIATAWIGGFISITIISLLSLLGVVLIPLMNRVFFKFLLSFLVALAVGTLSGDAFLHLIPHSQGGHHHHHNEDFETNLEEHHLHGEEDGDLDAVWKGVTALGGVYFMFLIEHFLTLGKMYKDKKQKVQKKWENNAVEKQTTLGENDLKSADDVETNGAGTFGDHPSTLHDGSVAEEEQVMLAPPVAVVSSPGYGRASGSAATAVTYTDEDCENKCHSHFHDTVGQADSMHHHHHDYHHILHHHHSQNHHPHSHAHSYSEQHFQQAGVAALAWMVIMGDGLHNFSDGLAIGAAFTEGLSSGLSTSVAVFCHELPHELGDFAVLLKAGMTVRQAILYNVLSAMMAFLGMITGILIGHYAANISMWIFALTAGLFMYVALVDMVPEMLHNDAGDHGFSHCGFFLLQNAGILLGFCIMLLIAIFEHKIQLDLGY